MGWLQKLWGIHIATPVFDGATENDVFDTLEEAGLAAGTGKPSCTTAGRVNRLKTRVTVGVMYMIKLAHMVDDKIHARSTGPYSLVTQQPLGR